MDWPPIINFYWAPGLSGLFGGVIGSIVFAILTDIFPFHQRGRVMGFTDIFCRKSGVRNSGRSFPVESLGLASTFYYDCHYQCDCGCFLSSDI